MGFATDARAFSSALIADLGNSATLKDKTTNTYDPSTGTATVSTTDRSVTVAGPFGYDAGLIDGDLIQSKDASVVLSAEDVSGWTPDLTESVEVNGRTWAVVKVTPIVSQDVTVAWELQLR